MQAGHRTRLTGHLTAHRTDNATLVTGHLGDISLSFHILECLGVLLFGPDVSRPGFQQAPFGMVCLGMIGSFAVLTDGHICPVARAAA